MSETRVAYEARLAAESPPESLRLLEQTLALWYVGEAMEIAQADEMLANTWEAYCEDKGIDPDTAC